MDFVMVSAPKPPGSSTSISPCAAVLLMAPAKVLHGAVRLHGFASSPTPDIQGRVACPLAVAAANTKRVAARTNVFVERIILLESLSFRFQELSRIRTGDGSDLAACSYTSRLPPG